MDNSNCVDGFSAYLLAVFVVVVVVVVVVMILFVINQQVCVRVHLYRVSNHHVRMKKILNRMFL